MAIVYAHYRENDTKPFYIGIGKSESRLNFKINRNKYWKHITENNKWVAKILHNNISWEEACKLEILLIKGFGRYLYEGGSLCNLSTGGDGGKMPQKSLEKISKRVYQYSLDDKLLNSYYSVREAARIMRVDKESIRRCCTNKKKTSCKYKWSYTKK